MIAKNYSRWLLSFGFLVLHASTIVEAREPFLNFSVITPCASDTNRPVVLHFKGIIDGSEVIEITHEQAVWRHLHWGWPPKPIVLADVSWDPRQRPVLPNRESTRFLHQLVDFSSAEMKVIKGRDLVALKILPAGLRLVINDTVNGAAEYELMIALQPLAAEKHVLRIVADIDGSDQLHINRNSAFWKHLHWSWPSSVKLNGVAWNPRESNVLVNRNGTAFLPRKVDLRSAQIVSQSGRDTIILEHVDDGLVVHFGDSPNGRARYEVVIALDK
jgi:hypothetical protein